MVYDQPPETMPILLMHEYFETSPGAIVYFYWSDGSITDQIVESEVEFTKLLDEIQANAGAHTG
jgi:hypothetical protein